eukprot:6789997-Pyramimonas_sp.AAC.1
MSCAGIASHPDALSRRHGARPVSMRWGRPCGMAKAGPWKPMFAAAASFDFFAFGGGGPSQSGPAQ